MAAIELGAPYYVYNPAQNDYFALNVPNDPNFVGYVTEVTGLDDAGVRENAQVVVAGDGGYHGPFWRDRRPWTISGFIVPNFPTSVRSAAVEHIEKVMGQCMRADGFLQWVPSDGVRKYVAFRKQQPMRDTVGQTNVQRVFTLAGVVADWRILAAGTLPSVTAIGPLLANQLQLPAAQNIGTADAAPIVTIFGPINTPQIININTGKQFVLNYSVANGDRIIVDLSTQYPTVYEYNLGQDITGTVATNADWDIAVAPGYNQFYVNELGSPTSSSATQAILQWRHSWL